jgi:hypothetical protein
MKKTYWLYRGNELLTAIRLPEGATDKQVIDEAIRQHNVCPLQPTGFAPFEWEERLQQATVAL